MRKCLILGLLAFALLSCDKPEGGDSTTPAIDNTALVKDASRRPFYKFNPVSSTPSAEIKSEEQRLAFGGWGAELPGFTLNFPEGESKRVILEYTMGSFGKGPADYDYTTMVFIKNKVSGEWIELVRAFTPFGGMFDAEWEKSFYIDVTEYRALMQGDTEFCYYYGGFDATEERAHSFKLSFMLYDGKPERSLVAVHKLYDSFNEGNSGYRGWAYGVAGHDIEAEERLGQRRVAIPEGVTSMELRLSITGHGHDKGRFPDRPDYVPHNMAEFDENTYSFVVDGYKQSVEGSIFYSNADNYLQQGTYNYDRANWAPGNPANIQYWSISRASDAEGELTIDIDLPRFESSFDAPNAEGVAQYIVVAYLFMYSE